MGRAGASTHFFDPPRGVADWAALPFFIEQATTRWDSEYVSVKSFQCDSFEKNKKKQKNT
jgi:hypothetical protein